MLDNETNSGADIDKRAAERMKACVSRRFEIEATDDTLRQIRSLAYYHMAPSEMAAILRVPQPTFQAFLERSLEAAEEIERGLAEGKLSLRRALFRLAEQNAQVAMFLAKHLLLQSDERKPSNTGIIQIVIDTDDAAV
ncbi:hypothetical protein SAMN04488498_10810 [Mesorhizobium albiziae]|uniref:Uncharacterized protein n=1 Tax=Neomesorhizobium albiziae TaxID=335020 RepID=A0A1I4AE25_9HYPH|nr:hypothetical protein [Mesorhizobium albiziae]GLS32809.1 hypothetical protein GCM10007937_45190 [Mesorhizobium albiziae]SFK54604.1 hypothetical protein SAMN04488498_10810 [Mesorhizobium albiziae]